MLHHDLPTIDCRRIVAETFVAQVEHHESLESTQQRAHAVAADRSHELPLLVIANRQTAGRGRGQNRWWTGEGSLAFSLCWDPARNQPPAIAVPQRSLAAAVATIDAVAPLVPERQVGLHWPNDIFVGGRKLAGILIDVLADGRHILGIGINTNNDFSGAPADVRTRATSLVEQTGSRVDHTELLIRLLTHLEHVLDSSSPDQNPVSDRFNELCLQHGERITIDVGGQLTTGICKGIDRDGGLVLETANGRRRFTCGVLR